MKKLWLVVCGLFASVLVYFGLSRRDKSKQIEATKRESEEKDVALTDAHVELEVTNAVSTRSLADNLMRDGAGKPSRGRSDN